METNDFSYYGNKDIITYYNWLKKKTENDEYYIYDVLANVNDYSRYDLMQMKTDVDGDYTLQFIELKGRYLDINQYPDSAVEYNKIYQLQKFSYMTNIPSYLVAIYYNNNKLCIWKIDPEKEYEFDEYLNTGSKCDPNRQEKEMKKMVHLPFSEAKIYNIN